MRLRRRRQRGLVVGLVRGTRLVFGKGVIVVVVLRRGSGERQAGDLGHGDVAGVRGPALAAVLVARRGHDGDADEADDHEAQPK